MVPAAEYWMAVERQTPWGDCEQTASAQHSVPRVRWMAAMSFTCEAAWIGLDWIGLDWSERTGGDVHVLAFQPVDGRQRRCELLRDAPDVGTHLLVFVLLALQLQLEIAVAITAVTALLQLLDLCLQLMDVRLDTSEPSQNRVQCAQPRTYLHLPWSPRAAPTCVADAGPFQRPVARSFEPASFRCLSGQQCA